MEALLLLDLVFQDLAGAGRHQIYRRSPCQDSRIGSVGACLPCPTGRMSSDVRPARLPGTYPHSVKSRRSVGWHYPAHLIRCGRTIRRNVRDATIRVSNYPIQISALYRGSRFSCRADAFFVSGPGRLRGSAGPRCRLAALQFRQLPAGRC